MGIQGVSATYRFNVTGSSVDLDDLVEELLKAKKIFNAPDDIKLLVKFTYNPGDPRDQRESNYTSFTISPSLPTLPKVQK